MEQKLKKFTDSDVRKIVREKYGEIAVGDDSYISSTETKSASCCGPGTKVETGPSCGPEVKRGGSCCSPETDFTDIISRGIGYTENEINSVPEGANLGLGCGNPVALASLKEGDVVLDLGSGAGFDAFLAREKVGKKGKVIGVDMTPEMTEKARENVRKLEEKKGETIDNVEFRLGEIENLPVSDDFVDIIISNCVINLSPDKERVFREAHRVLKPGGRLMVSDLVLTRELPVAVRNSVEAYVGCVAGAMLKDDYIGAIREAGFTEVKVVEESSYTIDGFVNDPMAQNFVEERGLSKENVVDALDSVVSAKISARK